MDEKSSETLFPSTKGHVINIPNEVQPLTIKDSTVFIGKNEAHRPGTLRFRFLMVAIILLGFGIGAIILRPVLYRAVRVGLIDEIMNSVCNSSLNRGTSSLATSASSNVVSQTESSSTSERRDATLFSINNPYSSLSELVQFSTVYIAHSGQATLSFFIQDGYYSTYIDNITVTNSNGDQLLVNGNFENGTFGWQGVSYISTYSYSYCNNRCYNSDYQVGNTLSQTFNVAQGTVLYIGFKLRWTGSGSTIRINVTIC
ncbi:unnamed protein product [Adineta steineri]|uniref:Uncharacterized protein n=1 Tax=Adineta steineri TaxID=433720 RepID=A0A814G0X5_9BILA|nr:unnamed protein product [Adineta steineri]CAF4063941.1 unnamed protein product [Adineta steineri]